MHDMSVAHTTEAEVQRLRDVEQSLMGTVDGLQGDLDDLKATHQRLQDEHTALQQSVTITISKAAADGKSQPKSQSNQYQFKFDGVLHDASQEEVYEAAAADVVKAAVEGFNGTVLTYGQTGKAATHNHGCGCRRPCPRRCRRRRRCCRGDHCSSRWWLLVPVVVVVVVVVLVHLGAGKTYTMSGGRQSFKQRGIIPRALAQLFAEFRALEHCECQASIQYLEIYNEMLYDLLDITTQPHEISIFEGGGVARSASSGTAASSHSQLCIAGLKTVTVSSEAEALALLFEGETNRVIGEHQLNRESSRSHSLFIVTLYIRPRADPLGLLVASKLHLVDLAGSERVSKTRSEGMVLREAGHINKSLSLLEQVVLALGDKGREHVPFRSCRLTHVLKDALGGNSRTVMVANIWGEASQLDETLSTCRFAQRMMRVSCEVTPNVTEDSSARVKQLQRQVQELQAELALHDSMSGRQSVAYAAYTDQQRDTLREQAAMLAAGLNRVQLKQEGGGLWEREGEGQSSSKEEEEEEEEEELLAFWAAVGCRLIGACNAQPDEMPTAAAAAATPAHWQTALQLFQAGPGALPSQLLLESRQRLQASKKRAKAGRQADGRQEGRHVGGQELGLTINAIKRELDSLKGRADTLKSSRLAAGPEAAQVLGGEELAVLEQLQERKQAYREQFGELQMLRSELDYTGQQCRAGSRELMQQFTTWFLQQYGVEPPGAGLQEGDDPADPSSPSVASLSISASNGTNGKPAASAAGVPASATVPGVRTGASQKKGVRPAAASAQDGGTRAAEERAGGRLSTTRAAPSPARRRAAAGVGKTGGPTPGETPMSVAEAADPDAVAFYNAQQLLLERAACAGHRPGAVKKQVGGTAAFSGSRP
ncbi:P-loop containing nucleoside triphosphate hydrolase protein [Haematococcus lacustris]